MMGSLGHNPILSKGKTVLGFGKLIYLIKFFFPQDGELLSYLQLPES